MDRRSPQFDPFIRRVDAAIRALRAGSSVPHDEDLAARLVWLASLVASWAGRINLSGQHTVEEIIDGLVLDALSLTCVLPHFSSMVDIGSGAGFPGLPLALLHPESRVTLIESREKRHHFQRHAIRSVPVPNATTVRARAGQVTATQHDLAIAQAVASGPEALALAAAWVRPGGHVVIPTSDPPPARDAALSAQGRLERYRVALSDRPRAVWIIPIPPETSP